MSPLIIRHVRYWYTPVGTYGTITLPDGRLIYTVELPWRDNQVGVSCIPEGTYNCRVGTFNSADPPYENVELLNVPHRTFIEVHMANAPSDLRGCIAPVSELVGIKGQWGGSNSARAHRILMQNIKDNQDTQFQFKWEITSPCTNPWSP